MEFSLQHIDAADPPSAARTQTSSESGMQGPLWAYFWPVIDTLTGLDSPAAPKLHRSGMIGDTGPGQSEEWGKSRTITADVKMGEIAEVELTHHRIVASSADTVWGASDKLLNVGEAKEIYEMKGAGRCIWVSPGSPCPLFNLRQKLRYSWAVELSLS